MSQGINNDMTASKPRHIVKNLRWWMLVLFLLGVTVNYITRNSLGILAPELKSSLGITTEQYSWIVGAFQLAYTLFQPLCGWLIDVIGLKLGFMICAGLWALACLMHAGRETGYIWRCCASLWAVRKPRPPRQTPKLSVNGFQNQNARSPQAGQASVFPSVPCWPHRLSILPTLHSAGRAHLCSLASWRCCGWCCGGRSITTRISILTSAKPSWTLSARITKLPGQVTFSDRTENRGQK